LNANNGKDVSRSSSPLAKTESGETAAPKPAAGRITSSAALRKTGAAGGAARKGNVLGAKKTTSKLGAKKVTADLIDFDEAEKKAKEEAERIEKLGYDPDAEEEKVEEGKGATPLVSPTPISPSAATSSHTRQKSNAEIERLGMGVGRLGFGQIGGGKPAGSAAPAAKKNAGGFGSVGPVKASAQGNGKYEQLQLAHVLTFPPSLSRRF
jgi:ADP-ribosylation factor GTPase-activating protein 2/3